MILFKERKSSLLIYIRRRFFSLSMVHWSRGWHEKGKACVHTFAYLHRMVALKGVAGVSVSDRVIYIIYRPGSSWCSIGETEAYRLVGCPATWTLRLSGAGSTIYFLYYLLRTYLRHAAPPYCAVLYIKCPPSLACGILPQVILPWVEAALLSQYLSWFPKIRFTAGRPMCSPAPCW